MRRKKEIKIYKNHYLGTLSEEEADNLLLLQEQKVIPSLKNCITNLSNDVIDQLIEYAVQYNGQPILEDEEMNIGELSDLQTIGVAYLFSAGRCLLGDSTGMGKTVVSAGLINLCKLQAEREGREFRYLFLTEKHNLEQIRRKLVQFTGEYVHVSTGEEERVREYMDMNENGIWCSLVGSHSIMNNTLFYSWLVINLQKFDMVIIDEGYVIKNPNTGIAKNIRAVAERINRFIILNATPFEKEIRDFYTQLSIIDKDLLPSLSDIQSMYCRYSYSGFRPKVVGTKNEDEFKERIALRYFARTRSDNGSEMSGNKGIIMYSPLSKDQKYLMKRTTMWRMVCDCPNALDEDILFDEESVPKLQSMMDILNKHSGESVFVFCYYKEAQYSLYEYLTNQGVDCRYINGDTKQRELEEVIDSFNNGEFQVLISNKQRGTDIKVCDVSIFYSFDFNASRMRQIEGRIAREFDIKNKTIYLLCSKGRERSYLKDKVLKTNDSSEKLMNLDNSIIFEALKKEFYGDEEKSS